MAEEDKKPKIDLKSRLAKKPASSMGGSIPAPAGIPTGGIPRPPTPTPRPSGAPPSPSGIPAPPFGSAGSQRGAPRIDHSDPYASAPVNAVPTRQHAQSITVEMSEEVVAAQKKGRTKIAVLSLVTALVGGFLGFAAGSGAERGKAADAAIDGAKDLAQKVDESNKKATELADVLKSAREKLSKSTFPEQEVSKLGSINIPFSAADLNGKGIGRFNRDVLSMLIDFSTAVDKVNDQKEKLQNVLTGNKKGVTDFLTQATAPQVRWSVIVDNGPYGPWASMQVVPAPFLAKSDAKVKDKDGHEKAYTWPDELRIAQGDKQAVLKRYTQGNPVGSEGLFIPVDPASQNGVCPSDVLFKLRRELSDLEGVLRGDATPGEEKTGLLEAGTKLLDKLKLIGKNPA